MQQCSLAPEPFNNTWTQKFKFKQTTACFNTITLNHDIQRWLNKHTKWNKSHQFQPTYGSHHSRPQSLGFYWPTAGIESSGSNHFRHAPWMQTEWNRVGRIRVISFVISNWLLAELSIPAAGHKDCRAWAWEWDHTCMWPFDPLIKVNACLRKVSKHVTLLVLLT